MLHSIPIDIVELIILKSFNYGVFEELKKFLTKLKEPSRIFRINDKLTVFTNDIWLIEYILNKLNHKEYDKPSYISDGLHMWNLHGYSNRKNKPSRCSTDGRRSWWKDGNIYNTGDCPSYISNDGEQTWHNENRKPSHITIEGIRSINKNIFDYLG